MANRTALYVSHLQAGAKMVNFGGWDMPINYGSQIEEHNTVRGDAGMFDVSHMTAPGGPAPAHSTPKMAPSDLPEGSRGLQEGPLDPPEAAK